MKNISLTVAITDDSTSWYILNQQQFPSAIKHIDILASNLTRNTMYTVNLSVSHTGFDNQTYIRTVTFSEKNVFVNTVLLHLLNLYTTDYIKLK